MKMRAAVLTTCSAPQPFAKSKPLSIEEIELDPPGEGEVLVKVGGAGLCHSDLSIINGDRPRPCRWCPATKVRARSSSSAPGCTT